MLRVLRAVTAVSLLFSAAACGDDGTGPPGSYRFGQFGKLEAVLEVPIGDGNGTLEQRLSWGSSGEWALQESVYYRGLLGDQRFERNVTDVGGSKIAYGDAITRLNENPGESLFVDDLPPTLEPTCAGQTRVQLRIHDEKRMEDRTWIRCMEGSLGSLDPSTAGPTAASARVVQAVRTMLQGTYDLKGGVFRSRYLGTLPFGTLDRGENSGAALASPVVFTTFDPWQTFWAQHAGVRPIPPVDFTTDMVVVAMVGSREEAGDSVVVRRVLQAGEGTIVQYVERVPGDFCSPAGRTHWPYHVVVTPRKPSPFEFSALPREEFSCGG